MIEYILLLYSVINMTIEYILLNNSPKLGKNLSMNTIPPIGYY